MDPFEKPYWSKLQVELWVCTRSREAVGLAEHAPGRTRPADTSIGPDGLDDEAYDEGVRMFDDEIELIGTAIIRCGTVCSFDNARKEVIVALTDGRLRAYFDPANPHDQFFERVSILELWGDPRDELKNDNQADREPQQPEPLAVDRLRSGAPGRPTSMHLVQAELDRRIAAGNSWPTKAAGADELRNWLQHEHPTVPRLTAKTIKNRLGHKIPVCPKTPTLN
jgi:hypothetical protein